MPAYLNKKNLIKNYNYFVAGLVIIWTVMILLSIYHNIDTIKEQTKKLIQMESETSFKKDLLYRRWNSAQGGVYAQISERTQPNPYLDLAEREIETPSNRKLTLINPAYMTRMVYEYANKDEGLIGHMTSLMPIRPLNTPDNWEEKALKSFESGNKEFSSKELMDGKEYLRYMRPFYVEKPCLKCHEKQGYKEGDIRGGLAIAIPTEGFRSFEFTQVNNSLLRHSLIWILVSISILVTSRFMRKNIFELKESEEKFNVLFNNISDAVIVFRLEEKEMNIFEVNEKSCQILGYSKDELLKVNPRDIFPDIDILFIKKIMIDKKVDDSVKESFAMRKDKLKIPVEITTQQFYLHGENTTLAIARDITLRKATEEKINNFIEELKYLNETKDKLFSIIGHDLRGPIGNLTSMLKVLASGDEDVDEELKNDFLKSMIDSAESSYILLENLLDWSRSQRNAIIIKKEIYEIKPVVEEAISLLSGAAGKKNINLTMEIEPGLSAFFDGNTISTVIRNLISNSIKFTKEGGRIIIRAIKENGLVQFSVSDDGVGMDQSKLESLFKKETYITTSGTKGEKGSGLGLSLCKDFVEKNGGELKVESEVGKGTTISFCLNSVG
jgi:PAS domain S-box-containing protein